MARKKKYLLLYLNTGGGHLAPAKSIARSLSKNFGEDVDPVLINGFENANFIIKHTIEGGYRKLQANARWLYEILYAVYKINFVLRINSSFISYFVKPYLKNTFRTLMPEKVIIFHFFLIEPAIKALHELKMNIPVITVVTDPYTAHPLWLFRKDQNFIIFSERLKSHCIDRGIEEKNIHVFPFILNEKFSVSIPPDKTIRLKSAMGFNTGKKLVLILGGGDGIPKGYRIIKLLLHDLPDVEIAIVCGNNTILNRRVMKLKMRGGFSNLKIYGYIDFIYELLNISDLVITKCGASTFMEIIMSKKIPLIINYIWEQEKGNMEYLVDKEMGIYEPDITKLPELIKGLFNDECKYSKYIENINKEFLQNGDEKVAEFINNFKGTSKN